MTTLGRPTAWPASPLWDAALTLYAEPEAAAACLRLQDHHDADVLLLLLACWLGRCGVLPSDEAAGRCRAVAADWANLVGPLRAVRRRLKASLTTSATSLPEPLAAARERVREAELTLERAALLALEHEAAGLPSAAPPGPQTAAEALRRLASLEPAARAELRVLLGAAWPRSSGAELDAAADASTRRLAPDRHPT